jgi:hypothetical protein
MESAEREKESSGPAKAEHFVRDSNVKVRAWSHVACSNASPPRLSSSPCCPSPPQVFVRLRPPSGGLEPPAGMFDVDTEGTGLTLRVSAMLSHFPPLLRAEANWLHTLYSTLYVFSGWKSTGNGFRGSARAFVFL